MTTLYYNDSPKRKKNKKNKDFIQVMDSRGNFSLAIKMPTKDYKPKPKPNLDISKEERKKEKNRLRARKWRQTHRKEYALYQKLWRKKNPEKVKAILKRHIENKKKQQQVKKTKRGKGKGKK